MAEFKVLFFLSTRGQDPSEVAIPWKYLTSQGVSIDFSTEDGTVAECDPRMLSGLLSIFLGATSEAKGAHSELVNSSQWKNPLSWSSPDFENKLKEYDGIILPGGHEKGMRQYLESTSLQTLLLDYFPKTSHEAVGEKKVVGAICHGVLALARAKKDGKSVLAIEDVETTTLPVHLERFAYFVTAPFLGKYYRTYDEYCAAEVQSLLSKPSNFQSGGFFDTKPFVVHDPKHYYVSGRFPADAQLFAKSFLQLLKKAKNDNSKTD